MDRSSPRGGMVRPESGACACTHAPNSGASLGGLLRAGSDDYFRHAAQLCPLYLLPVLRREGLTAPLVDSNGGSRFRSRSCKSIVHLAERPGLLASMFSGRSSFRACRLCP